MAERLHLPLVQPHFLQAAGAPVDVVVEEVLVVVVLVAHCVLQECCPDAEGGSTIHFCPSADAALRTSLCLLSYLPLSCLLTLLEGVRPPVKRHPSKMTMILSILRIAGLELQNRQSRSLSSDNPGILDTQLGLYLSLTLVLYCASI